MHAARHLWILAIATACSSKPAAPPQVVTAPVDAAIDGLAVGTFDTASGMHVDDDPVGVVPPRIQKRAGRPIDIVLRSTPSGARVHADGVFLGLTPTLWQGETGAEHEFTFVLKNHALARFRFVPIASGVVHPRLDPVADEADAGTPPPEVMPPQIAPPPTIVAPQPPVDAPAAPLPPPPIDAAPAVVVPPAVDAAASVPVGPQP